MQSHSMQVHMYSYVVMSRKYCFPTESGSGSGSGNLSGPSSAMTPQPWGEEDVMEISCTELGTPVSYSLHIDRSRVSVLVDINKQGEASLTKVESRTTYG